MSERERARQLRARSWTLVDIATELGVSKSSVSVWVRDVEFEPRPRNRGHSGHRPHPMSVKKDAELERCRTEAIEHIGDLNERDLEMFCLALYAGEGAKSEGALKFANSDPSLMKIFVMWLRRRFDIDESRLRMRLYLHADLDLDEATDFWSSVMQIPTEQFTKPYRAQVRGSFRTNRHAMGCASVVYSSRLVQRRVMAMISAVTSPFAGPG